MSPYRFTSLAGRKPTPPTSSQNYVFVIDSKQRPLHPIPPAKARKLLNKNQAAVFRLYPFTIVLKHEVNNFDNIGYELKIDPGSQTTGLAILNSNNQVIWVANLEHRGLIIKKNLSQRSSVRRGRRHRNTRYRIMRVENRKRNEGWLPPSLMHRVLTIETWVKRLSKFCPLHSIVMELVKFDTQKMNNSEIDGIEYQQGTLWGYEVREYLLEKWGRNCVYCGKADRPLQVEHIKPKSKGGSDRVSNLTLACERCNLKKSDQMLSEFLKKKPALLKKMEETALLSLNSAAAVNSTRWKLFECLKQFNLPISTGRGSQTKYNRIQNGLEKQHYVDAACVGETGLGVVMIAKQPLIIKSVGTGGRQKAALNKFGYPTRHNLLKPLFGYCTGDYARHHKYGIGRVTPRSNGKFVLTLFDKSQFAVQPKDLKAVFRKDSYAYKFG